MRKNFNTFIMNHMQLINFIFSILCLTLFLILFIVVKMPVEDLMKKSFADFYYRWIKYNIYENHSFQIWLIFILVNLGLLGNVLLILYLIIISLFNKRIIKLLVLLTFLSFILVSITFISGIVNTFIPYLILCPVLYIVIITVLFINIKYNKYKENLNEQKM